MIKENEKMELYVLVDKVAEEEVMYFKANNNKSAVRSLLQGEVFKVYRKEDIELKKANFNCCKLDNVDIGKCLEELKINFEEKAEKIEGTESEVANKIMTETGKKGE